MEFDCDIFEDTEATLDALLSRANWPDADAEMSARLRAAALSQPLDEPAEQPFFEPKPDPIVEPYFEPVASPPATLVLLNTPADSARLRVVRTSRRPARFIGALAAGLLVAIGLAWLLVHQIIHSDRQSLVSQSRTESIAPLPGRAPNPLEQWAITPAGQRYYENIAQAERAAERPPSIPANRYRNADVVTLTKSLLLSKDNESRQLILSALFERGDGMTRYLDLILNPATRDRALVALDAMENPPRDLFLAQLDNAVIARRFAAAKALGTLCHGELMPKLKQMIQLGDHAREALAVLAECHDPAASAYLQTIRRVPLLQSQFITIQSQLHEYF